MKNLQLHSHNNLLTEMKRFQKLRKKTIISGLSLSDYLSVSISDVEPAAWMVLVETLIDAAYHRLEMHQQQGRCETWYYVQSGRRRGRRLVYACCHGSSDEALPGSD